ncbi:MAG TPA: AarF/UbiB family protein [Bryobacteraceae bacterium]|nr:AarF/UbiB family protein [Bryobacteraceae bacterium]
MIDQLLAGGDVRSFLGTAEGRLLREEMGQWIAQGLSVDELVPDRYSEWRPLVRDCFQFLFAQLSDARLAEKLVEQARLPLETTPGERLVRLLSKMPAIQKLGQVLARHQHLGATLRRELTELENGMSDAAPEEIGKIVAQQLGTRLVEYAVRVEPAILSEASICAVVRFTWRNPESGARERGVFKVLKPYVPDYFAEDLSLLQRLSEWLAGNREYGFATDHIAEMVTEVRGLLERELDFAREQAVLLEAAEVYRYSLGARVPRLIQPLCTDRITAMSQEDGVKITEALPGKVYQRRQVAEQLIEALVVVPLLSWKEEAVIHTDPHAGNLLYDERARQVVLLDWALTERLNREMRRQLTLLVVMTVLRNPGGVADAIRRLATEGQALDPAAERVIQNRVGKYFRELPYNYSPGSLDAMRLLDRIALEGVRFPASLAMFQKALFTLDGVLYDIAGAKVSISCVLVRDYVVYLLASLGLDHPPLSIGDLIAVPRSALLYPARVGKAALLTEKVT